MQMKTEKLFQYKRMNSMPWQQQFFIKLQIPQGCFFHIDKIISQGEEVREKRDLTEETELL